LCKSVGGTSAGKKCTADAAKVKAWAKSQNELLTTLWGPMPKEEFVGAVSGGMTLGLVVAALLLVLHLKVSGKKR
jgi:uncharacterized protein (DUF2062 family)